MPYLAEVWNMKNNIARKLKRRINKRAHELSLVAFEDYRSSMMNDPSVIDGSVNPEGWHPFEVSKQRGNNEG